MVSFQATVPLGHTVCTRQISRLGTADNRVRGDGSVEGVRVSLRRDIRECQRYADTCARSAARAVDAKTRDDILRLRQNWLSLARCLALLPQSNLNLQQTTLARSSNE